MDLLAERPAPSQAALASAKAASTKSGHALTAIASAELAQQLRADLYRLDNGLEVLLAHDRRAPIFAYQTWFRVGSRDEEPARTGLAHLFEHLMFKGTKHRPTGTFDAEMERRGASTNAATWVDWTYYTQALASFGDNLSVLIGFEADRMQHLVLDEATFKSELDVVKNERRMAVDNSVAGQMSEALFALMFATHPYRWPTIGSMAHLEAASIADLEAFYRRHYRPDNATVVICGDVDAAATLTVVAEHYGPIKGGGPARRRLAAEAPQRATRAQVLVTQVQNPQAVIGFPAPPETDRAHAGLEMLLTMLTDGDTGWLYEALVTERKVVSEVSSYITPFAEQGLVEFHLVASAGQTLDRVLAEAFEVLRDVPRLLDEGALQKARNSLVFDYYDGLRDVESLAEALGHAQTNTGDFTKALRRPQWWQDMTVAELRQLAADTFAPHRQNVVLAVAQEADADSALQALGVATP